MAGNARSFGALCFISMIAARQAAAILSWLRYPLSARAFAGGSDSATGLARTLAHGRQFPDRRRNFVHGLPQLAKKNASLRRAVHENAASVARVGLASRQTKLLQSVQRTRNCRPRDFQNLRQPAHRVLAVLQIAGEQYPK